MRLHDGIGGGRSRALASWIALAAACGGGSTHGEPVEPTPVSGSASAGQGEPVEPHRNTADGEWSGEPPFERPQVSVSWSSDEAHVTVVLSRRQGVPLPGGPVPFTTEPYAINVVPDAQRVREADVLGTGLALDLDGDGAATGELSIGCREGVGLVAGGRIAPLGDARGHVLRYDRDPVARLGDGGASAVLYAPCSKADRISVGLSPPERPIEVRYTEGPVMQVLVFEPTQGPTLPSDPELDLRLDGRRIAPATHAGADYEALFDRTPSWHAMTWAMVPVADVDEQRLDLRLPNDGRPRLVVVRVNVSDEPDVRHRMEAAGSFLRP